MLEEKKPKYSDIQTNLYTFIKDCIESKTIHPALLDPIERMLSVINEDKLLHQLFFIADDLENIDLSDMIRSLSHFDESTYNSQELTIAIQFQNIPAIKRLLNARQVDPSIDNWNSLREAIFRTNCQIYPEGFAIALEIIDLLLENAINYNINLDIHGYTMNKDGSMITPIKDEKIEGPDKKSTTLIDYINGHTNPDIRIIAIKNYFYRQYTNNYKHYLKPPNLEKIEKLQAVIRARGAINQLHRRVPVNLDEQAENNHRCFMMRMDGYENFQQEFLSLALTVPYTMKHVVYRPESLMAILEAGKLISPVRLERLGQESKIIRSTFDDACGAKYFTFFGCGINKCKVPSQFNNPQYGFITIDVDKLIKYSRSLLELCVVRALDWGGR